ncbi:hypothetical protein DFQ30_006441 [Apophysomyces sp. BC1015]|nr:hypothetical protein DFQ30_006441 [Apophysomyces sp. BC1015]KAG0177267.1 hypothetical protein DFQ29_005044 [Apophysomyces sp. BC1021]
MGLIDPSTGTGREYELCVMAFHQHQESLPQIGERGDIVFFRKAKINDFNNRPQVIARSPASWLVLKQEDLAPQRSKNLAFTMSAADWAVARTLKTWYTESRESSDDTQAISQRSVTRPLLKTEDILQGQNPFFDYIGEVVACGDYDDFKRMRMMFLTDYTQNPQALTGESFEGTIEPQFLIQCSLFDENAAECPPLETGDFVFIKNAVKRISNLGVLEIRVHGARDAEFRYPKVNKIDATDLMLTSIKKRREAYRQLLTGRIRQGELYENKVHKVRTGALEDNLKGSKTCATMRIIRAYVEDYKPRNIKEWSTKWCQACDEVYLNVGSLQENPTAVTSLEERVEEICSGDADNNNKTYLDFHIASHVSREHTRRYVIRDTQFVFE